MSASPSRSRAPFAPDLLPTLPLAVAPPLLLPLLTASTPVALTAVSASPANVLATIRLEAPAWLSATVAAGGTVDLQWGTSASAASRDVGYAVLRRQTGASSFLEIARTSAVTFTDAPAPASYDYAVRTVIATFASAESPLARADVPP